MQQWLQQKGEIYFLIGKCIFILWTTGTNSRVLSSPLSYRREEKSNCKVKDRERIFTLTWLKPTWFDIGRRCIGVRWCLLMMMMMMMSKLSTPSSPCLAQPDIDLKKRSMIEEIFRSLRRSCRTLVNAIISLSTLGYPLDSPLSHLDLLLRIEHDLVHLSLSPSSQLCLRIFVHMP